LGREVRRAGGRGIRHGFVAGDSRASAVVLAAAVGEPDRDEGDDTAGKSQPPIQNGPSLKDRPENMTTARMTMRAIAPTLPLPASRNMTRPSVSGSSSQATR